MIIYNGELKTYARKLRNRMTDAEMKLWSIIRMKQLNGYQFYRQRIIGSYKVDFCCPKANIVIEVYGSQHYNEKGIKADSKRDRYMKIRGFNVLRFKDNEVLTNIQGVTESILGNIRV